MSVSLFKIPQTLSCDSGFTLLSLVFLVLVISFSGIAVVTTLLPSALTRQIRETTDKAALIRAGVQTYAFHHGGVSGTHLPSLETLVTTDGIPCAFDRLSTSPTYLSLQGWCGPYIDSVFLQNLNDYKTDGWGTAFAYDALTTVISSCGPNRTCGDADDISFSP